MSGGSLEYLCYKIDNAIEEIYNFKIEDIDTGKTHYYFRGELYARFLAHLEKVSKALHDIEWIMDGDMSEGADKEAIEKVLSSSKQRKSK